MAKKLTNKELLNMTIDEEILKSWTWLFKNSYRFSSGTGFRLPMKEILEMYKKENP